MKLVEKILKLPMDLMRSVHDKIPSTKRKKSSRLDKEIKERSQNMYPLW